MSGVHERHSGVDDASGASRTPEIGTIAQKYNQAFSKAVAASRDGRSYRTVSMYLTPSGFEALTRTQALKEFIKTGGKVHKLSAGDMIKMVDVFREGGYRVSEKSEKIIRASAGGVTSGMGILTTKKAQKLFEEFSNPDTIKRERDKIVSDSLSPTMRDVTSHNTKAFGSNSLFRGFPTDDAKVFSGKCHQAAEEIKEFRISPDKEKNEEINQKLDETVRILDELVNQGTEISGLEGLKDCYGYNPQVSAEQFDKRLLDNDDCEGGSKIGQNLDPKLREQLEARKAILENLSKRADQLDSDLSKTGNLLASAVSISVSSNAKRMLKEINQLLGNETMPRNPLYEMAQAQQNDEFAAKLT
ncbi:MAG: hypothetical protein JSS12_07215, partial [Verrucomicrobia bacterium]|nr:hypothetical protein [Verrucomicrobiota bacterium]